MGFLDLFKPKKRDVKDKKNKMSLSKISEPLELLEIAKNNPYISVCKEAVKRIGRKHQEILRDVVTESSNIEVKIAAIKKINDQKILSELYQKSIELNYPKSIRIGVVKRMKDTSTLTEISKNDSSVKVRNAAKRRIFSLGPKICSYTVKVDCPHCSNPLILNGPLLNVKCSYCMSEVALDSKFWGNVIRVRNSTLFITLGDFRNAEVDCKLMNPRCLKCNSELKLDNVPTGSVEPIKCSKCGAKNTTFPAPEWMKRFKKYGGFAEQIFCGSSEKKRSRKETSGMKPILFSCLQCGGSLKITVDTLRITSCNYCGVSQYLPDELWLSLHPVKKKKEWFVRWKSNN